MPRDDPRSLGEVTLPAGRSGRVVETVTAGQFAVVTAATWVDLLFAAGHLGLDERDAADRLHEAFEMSGIRPRLAGAYDGVVVDGSGAGGMLETLGRTEFRAWRRCNHLFDQIPPKLRSQVSAVVLWDTQPWNISELRLGLRALSAVLHQSRRR